MILGNRYELLEWARLTESYIIEDDYNHEFKYRGKPIESLQGMDDSQRVIYLGSFSTLLIPSIRISFLVLPQSLSEVLKNNEGYQIQSASKLEQLALASMIENGDFGKHLRRVRKNYKEKYQRLAYLLEKHLTEYCLIHIPPAGISALLTLKKHCEEAVLRDALKKRGIELSLLSEYLIHKRDTETLVLNYRGIPQWNLEKAVLTIKEVLCRLF